MPERPAVPINHPRRLRPAPQQLAEDFDVPLEAVQEAIVYCQSDHPELREDHRKQELLHEAIGMNDPAIWRTGRPKPLTTEERVRLGL